MRRHRAGHEARPVRNERLEVVGVEVAVLAHAPPLEGRSQRLQRQPGGDIGVVVHVGDDDLAARRQHLADAEADEADERGGVHAEADFGRVTGVDQQRHAFARIGDCLVDGDAAGIAAAALHVVGNEMVGDGVEHVLRDLRAGGVVHEDEVAGPPQRRKQRTDRVHRKGIAGAFLRLPGLMLVHSRVLFLFWRSNAPTVPCRGFRGSRRGGPAATGWRGR